MALVLLWLSLLLLHGCPGGLPLLHGCPGGLPLHLWLPRLLWLPGKAASALVAAWEGCLDSCSCLERLPQLLWLPGKAASLLWLPGKAASAFESAALLISQRLMLRVLYCSS